MTTTATKHWLLDAQPDIATPEDLSADVRQIGQVTQSFVDKEIYPRMEELEAKPDGLNRQLIEKAAELGLFLIEVAEEDDGLNLPKAASALVSEKFGGTGGFGVTFGGQGGIGLLPLVYFGTPEQRAKHIPKITSGEWISAYALTEPGSGSDAMSAKSYAVQEGDHYVLNGGKMWITNGGIADIYTVFAQLRTPEGDRFSAFLVERTSPGFSVGNDEHKMGLHSSSTTALSFDNVRLPLDSLLGQPGDGAKIAFNILNTGRYKLGAACVGAAKDALKTATKYAQEREQFRQPIASFGAIREKVATIAYRTFAVESATYRVVGAIDEAVAAGTDKLTAIEQYAAEASMLKVLGSELLDYAVDEGVQIHGGYGFSAEYDIERQYRDSRIQRIFEGTNEINRLIIPDRTLRALGSQPGKPDLAGTGDWLRDTVHNLTSLSLALLRQADAQYGKALKGQQPTILRLADLLMLAFAATSAAARAQKLGSEMAQNMAQLYVYEAAERSATLARELFRPLELESDDQVLGLVKALTSGRPDTFNLRESVAAHVLDASGYAV